MRKREALIESHRPRMYGTECTAPTNIRRPDKSLSIMEIGCSTPITQIRELSTYAPHPCPTRKTPTVLFTDTQQTKIAFLKFQAYPTSEPDTVRNNLAPRQLEK